MRPSELRKAERKAEREELKKFEEAVAIIGLGILGELAKELSDRAKPTPTSKPVPTPTQSEELIIDAEYVDVERGNDSVSQVMRT